MNNDQRQYIKSLESHKDDESLIRRMEARTRPLVNITYERISLTLEQSLMDQIDNACENMGGITRSELIRLAIKDWLQQNPDKTKNPDSPLD